MISLLIDIQIYTGNTPFGDQLMIGTAPYLPSLHDHTKSFLNQKRQIEGKLPPPATPTTQQKYTEKVNRGCVITP